MAVTPMRLLTCTGVVLSVVVPSPNCPSSFRPQAHTVPSDFRAIVCPLPPATIGVVDAHDAPCAVISMTIENIIPNNPIRLTLLHIDGLRLIGLFSFYIKLSPYGNDHQLSPDGGSAGHTSPLFTLITALHTV